MNVSEANLRLQGVSHGAQVRLPFFAAEVAEAEVVLVKALYYLRHLAIEQPRRSDVWMSGCLDV